MLRYGLLLAAVLIAPIALAQDRERTTDGPTMVVGPKNLELHLGAKALLAGRTEEGIEHTLHGLESAQGIQEEKAAISNLCSGYTVSWALR